MKIIIHRIRNFILFISIWKILLLPADASAQEVPLQLKWTHQSQFAGYYAAIQKGLYQNDGLDDTLQKEAPNTTIVDEVVQELSHFRVDNSSLIRPLICIIGVLTLGLILFIIFNIKLNMVRKRTFSLEKKLDELKEKEEIIRRLAYYDTLTNLPNRLYIKDMISAKTVQDGENGFAVVIVDLDDFKRINDAMGHAVGDDFLKIATQRILDSLRDNDTVARIGGDEFILLLSGLNKEKTTLAVEKIIHAIKEPLLYRENLYYLSASAGIAFCPQDGQEFDDLIKAAAMALYEAKRQGKNRFVFFTEKMQLQSINRLELEMDLHQAINNHSGLVLHYQPQISYDGSIVGVEALVRWNHPTKGLLYPDSFIPLAEETGLILPLGDWVTLTACKQNMEWQKSGYPPMRISVNLSVKQFQHPYLLQNIQNILQETGLPPHLLELEITETVAISHAELTLSLLNSLRSIGVRLALDDFGVGYSSFMYLKNFPIDNLKIDKSFIRDITLNQESQAIIQAILQVAKSLRFKVVAEGVETSEQLASLRKLNCPIMQGYLFSRPVPADKIDTFLQGGNQWNYPDPI
ncbi:putative bifunctional diguanylate cyclase/phosphodiesterase [Pelosinus baikalensis]|uniref:EAL domain-containing protein n=1 Tax=Pelosinus baikalensis TaxID=2892015 RepID=A0ABS8HT29_9FIRM|nr:EAL domain-containing protein [Pelosinus baikalensis]MCC5466336.1 EAL domain-containing protein [Pelosinus baikalensis]